MTFSIEVQGCPDYHTCEFNSVKICPDGYYCPTSTLQRFEPRECPLGTWNDEEGQGACKDCSVGSICPDTRLFKEQACPGGFVCDQANVMSLKQLKECPEGYICPNNQYHNTTFDTTNLTKDFNIQRCPDQYYCPKGMSTINSIYGNFTTPQLCRDGVICSQNIFMDETIN